MYHWQIGDVEFKSWPENDFWVTTGTIGDLVIVKDFIIHGPIERTLDWSSYWVQEYTRKLFTEAVNFSPSDVL